MARLGNTGIMGFIASMKRTAGVLSEHFLSGFNGHGWKIWEHKPGKYKLETDDILVRGSMTIYELLISQIRAVRGALGITQASGKVKSVFLNVTENYIITFDETYMSFRANDFIRCQRFAGPGTKHYHVKILSVLADAVIIPASEFVGYDPPEPGDEVVQFGNETDTTRQSAIYIHADGSGQPAIDVMFGINSKDWSNNIKIRVGGDIPGTDGEKGFYCENGKIVCKDAGGNVMYSLNPDGSGSLAKGGINWDAEGVMSWGEGAIDDLKGEKGDPGDDADADQFREDVATALGYDSYDAMVEAVGVDHGNTIIQDGHIRTNLIDVQALIAMEAFINNLVVRSLSTDTGEVGHKQRVVIDKTNHCIRIYNDSGTEVFSLAKTSSSNPTYVQIGRSGIETSKYYNLSTDGLVMMANSNIVACLSTNRGLKLPNDLPVDIPGFLFAGKMNAGTGGMAAYHGGKCSGSTSFSNNKVYSIGHTLGHTNYFVNLTCYANANQSTYTPMLVSKNADSFEVIIKDDAGYSRDDIPFEFAVFGKN